MISPSIVLVDVLEIAGDLCEYDLGLDLGLEGAVRGVTRSIDLALAPYDPLCDGFVLGGSGRVAGVYGSE